MRGGQNTSGGVNWPRSDSEAKSSACAGRSAWRYSLCGGIEMEGRPVAPRLSFGGAAAERGAHMDALTPQPARGPTGDLKSEYRPKVMRELGVVCCCGSGFRSAAHVDDILFRRKRLHGIVWSSQTHLYSPRVHSLDKNENRKLVVCIIRACSTHHECFFIYFCTSTPPHSTYA